MKLSSNRPDIANLLVLLAWTAFLLFSNNATAQTQVETAKWETLETKGNPTARHEASLVTFEEKLYLIGGRRINPVDEFDPATGVWTEKSKSPMELHHFQAVVFGDAIYLIGAMTGPYPNEKPLEKVVVYYPKQDKFEFVHHIPEQRRRGGAGAVVHNGKIYIVGGISNGHIGGFRPWLDEYDPTTGAWTPLADAPHARDHFQAVVSGQRLISLGGRTTSQGTGQLFALTVPEVDVYDFEKGKWLDETNIPPLPTPRAGNMAFGWKDKVIVGGGETDQDFAHNEVEALNTTTNVWSRWPGFARGRHGTGLAIIGDYVYAASGCAKRGGDTELKSIERLKLSDVKDQPLANNSDAKKPAGKKLESSERWRKYAGNRFAISADGNSEPDDGHKWKTGDPDDWGATPVTLAIISKLDCKEKLVHFSYNNFIAAPAGPDESNQMKIGVDGSIKRWNFDSGKFFDVLKDTDLARNDLKKALAKSTAEDPLYFLHMGPSEFFYQAVKELVDEGTGDALSHVYIVSHSGYNDEHLRRDNHHTLAEAIAYSNDRLNYKRIKDQNGDWDPHVLWNSKEDFSPWHWMRDSDREDMRWLFERVKAHAYGKADVSDAGLVFWLLKGDEDGSPEKLKSLLMGSN